jgi:hypothetical protein
MSTLDEIESYINWFSNNAKSTDLTAISLTLGKMSTQCYYFSKLVSDAYDLQSEAEDEFKTARSAFVRDYSGGVTKAQAIAEADPVVKEKRVAYTKANSVYMRLKNYSQQFEQILDCKRQFISVEKSLNVKGV